MCPSRRSSLRLCVSCRGATLLLSRSCPCSSLPSSLSLSLFLSSSFARATYICTYVHTYTLSRFSLLTYSFSPIRSVRPSIFFHLSRVQCTHSHSLSLSLARSHRPSPGSFARSLSLSLFPLSFSGFVPDTPPAASPAPGRSSSSRQPHRFSFCVLSSAYVHVCVYMCGTA
mgnify:CR=1 FL=1